MRGGVPQRGRLPGQWVTRLSKVSLLRVNTEGGVTQPDWGDVHSSIFV